MPRLPIDYANTLIYKIVCNDLNVTECYVGHTTDFVRRKKSHKHRCITETDKKHNLKVYKIIRDNGGWDNFSMVEIEKFPCNDVNEAKKKEREWFEKLNSSLNTNFPQRSKEEYYIDNKDKIAMKNKEYYIDNKDESNKRSKEWRIVQKDEIAIYMKEYANKNKDEIAIYKKKYAEKNKDEIAIKRKEYCIVNKDEIAIKHNTYYIDNKVEILERVNKYREENKEKIAEHNKEMYEINRLEILEKHKTETFVCECGREIKCCRRSRHSKTKVHNDNMKPII